MEENHHNKQFILIVASLASFITAFMGSSINIALPALGEEFRIDAVLLSWISTSYLLAAAISLVPAGRLADLYGRKKIFAYGIVIFTVATLISGMSNSIPLLLFSRVLTGIGVGMVFGTSVAIVTSAFPISERGKAIGFTVSAVYLGLSMGPFIGGILTQNFGWRSIFFASVLMGLVTTFVTMFIKGEWAEARNEKMVKSFSDILGNILSIRCDGSAALDLAHVAQGIFDGYYQKGIHIWVIAAGSLIVKEAKGRVSDFSNGDEYLSNGEIFASNGLIHEDIIKYLNI